MPPAHSPHLPPPPPLHITIEDSPIHQAATKSLIPAPELAEVSDIRPDTTSGEEDLGAGGGGGGKVPPLCRSELPSEEPLSVGKLKERDRDSTEEDVDSGAPLRKKRNKRKKVTSLTVSIARPDKETAAILAELEKVDVEGGDLLGGQGEEERSVQHSDQERKSGPHVVEDVLVSVSVGQSSHVAREFGGASGVVGEISGGQDTTRQAGHGPHTDTTGAVPSTQGEGRTDETVNETELNEANLGVEEESGTQLRRNSTQQPNQEEGGVTIAIPVGQSEDHISQRGESDAYGSQDVQTKANAQEMTAEPSSQAAVHTDSSVRDVHEVSGGMAAAESSEDDLILAREVTVFATTGEMMGCSSSSPSEGGRRRRGRGRSRSRSRGMRRQRGRPRKRDVGLEDGEEEFEDSRLRVGKDSEEDSEIESERQKEEEGQETGLVFETEESEDNLLGENSDWEGERERARGKRRRSRGRGRGRGRPRKRPVVERDDSLSDETVLLSGELNKSGGRGQEVKLRRGRGRPRKRPAPGRDDHLSDEGMTCHLLEGVRSTSGQQGERGRVRRKRGRPRKRPLPDRGGIVGELDQHQPEETAMQVDHKTSTGARGRGRGKRGRPRSRAHIPALFVPVQSGNWSTGWFPTEDCSSPRPASAAETKEADKTKETSEVREAGGGVQCGDKVTQNDTGVPPTNDNGGDQGAAEIETNSGAPSFSENGSKNQGADIETNDRGQGVPDEGGQGAPVNEGGQGASKTEASARGRGGGGEQRRASEGGGRLLERIVESLVERSHGVSVQGRRGRGRGKRKTLTARKPSQKLSVVEREEEEVGWLVI